MIYHGYIEFFDYHLMPTHSLLSFEKPGLVRRLAAIFYDLVLISALIFLFLLPWVNIMGNGKLITKIGMLIIIFSLPIGFYLFFWNKEGKTLGMMAWRLQLRSSNNQPFTSKQLIIRYIGAWVSLLCLGLGYLWVLVDKDQMTWHDRLSKTELILLPKKNK